MKPKTKQYILHVFQQMVDFFSTIESAFFSFPETLVNIIQKWMFPKIGVPPKSSILIGFSIINHPFWCTTIFGNTQMVLSAGRPCGWLQPCFWMPGHRLQWSILGSVKNTRTKKMGGSNGNGNVENCSFSRCWDNSFRKRTKKIRLRFFF